MSYLKIENLYTQLGNFSLEIKNVAINKGDFFGILGESGAGKSTFLNLLCGLEDVTRGEIFLDGEYLISKPSHTREIAYLFQEPLLFEHLNVYENLEYILKAKGIDKNRYEVLITKALQECEVDELKERFIDTLSGGQKQRVALASAIMLEPKLLLLDEPFSSLDRVLRVKMRRFIKYLTHKLNITSIMVTHDIEDAYELFDEMMILEGGELLQKGTLKELYENPQSTKVAKLLGFENIFNGNIHKGVFSNLNFQCSVLLEDEKDIDILIPYDAITHDDSKEVYRVDSSLYIGGKYRLTLENGLIIYNKENLQSICIRIDSQKIKRLKR